MHTLSRHSAGRRMNPIRAGRPELRKIMPAMLITFVLSASFPCTAQASFVQQNQFGSSHTIGVAWGDPDEDGDLDLAIGNFLEANQLYVGSNGSFTERLPFGAKMSTFAVSWCDVDNDGDADLVSGNGNNKQNQLFINNGQNTFTPVAQFGLNRTISVAWSDADLDGYPDLAVGNGILGTAQQNYLYMNNADGTFTEQEQFGQDQTDSVAWGDCDNDGDPDLAVGNGGFGTDAQNFLYINNGDGTFTARPEFGSGDTAAVAWGDCDNDGDLDLAVGNWGDGQNMLYVNSGTGTFTEMPSFGARDTNTIAWGDFDNDGDLDLAVGNGDFSSADQNYLYVNNGDTTFTETAEFGLGSTDCLAWGDCDGDGDLDMAVGNEHSPEQNWLFLNQQNDTHYLVIRLKGHRHDWGKGYSNRDGIGAKMTVYDAGFAGDPAHFIGFREVASQGGFSSRTAAQTHFGIPGGKMVDIRIAWPGSAGHHVTQTVTGVAPGQMMTIEEPATAYPPGVRIDMPDQVHPGMEFSVTGWLDNPGDDRENVPVFFLLDVFGDMWFWPEWSHYHPPDANDISFSFESVPSGSRKVEVLHTFTWPDTGSMEMNGLFFFGAMLNSSMSALAGEMAAAEWSFGP